MIVEGTTEADETQKADNIIIKHPSYSGRYRTSEAMKVNSSRLLDVYFCRDVSWSQRALIRIFTDVASSIT